MSDNGTVGADGGNADRGMSGGLYRGALGHLIADDPDMEWEIEVTVRLRGYGKRKDRRTRIRELQRLLSIQMPNSLVLPGEQYP